MTPPVSYSVERELTSPKWARAFASGCGGGLCKTDELQPGDVAMFGSPARWQMLAEARAKGRTWFYGDHAFWGRRAYYRISRNSTQVSARSGDDSPRRFDQWFVPVREWKRTGKYILLCPNSPVYFRWFGMTAEGWIEQTVRQLRRHTDRPIWLRWKNDGTPLDDALKNAWAVVGFTSVCGVHAALAGVPSFATAPCAARDFGTDDLSRIEDPVYPTDRLRMARILANQQWSIDEMAEGMAWGTLNEDVARPALS